MFFRKRFSSLNFDWPLLMGIIILSLFGLLILYSAKQQIEIIERQFYRILLASVFMIFVAQVPPRVFRSIAPILYFFGLTLILIVTIFGVYAKGGQRWLDLMFIRFQPSELMKIAVPLMVARHLDDVILPPKISNLFIPFFYIIVPTILVARQPDLGTALLIASGGLIVIFFAGISWRLLSSVFAGILLFLPILWYLMRDYQRDRILTLLNPERDPLGKSYQIIQSKIAIGSGGLAGKGWLNGTQSQLDFLPERTTDFIFAAFGEEFGLVGCLILLMLYLYIIIRGLYIGVQAQDTFSRLLSGSLIMTLFVYVFVNIGMVTGILPVVGIPLPLVSFGGTSLVTLMATMGILMSIHGHRTLLTK